MFYSEIQTVDLEMDFFLRGMKRWDGIQLGCPHFFGSQATHKVSHLPIDFYEGQKGSFLIGLL